MVKLSKSSIAGAVLGAAVSAALMLVPVLPNRRNIVTALAARFASRQTLVVAADLDCEWTLDSKPQGRLKARQTAVVTVEQGEHLVNAKTLDGKDEMRNLVVESHQSAQHAVAIGLQEIRDKRVAWEQHLAAEQAKQRETDKAKADVAETQRRGYWVDRSTDLMWAAQDNGFDIEQPAAVTNCANTSIAGLREWRVPSVDELKSIYDERVTSGSVKLHPGDVDSNPVHAKGGIQLSDRFVWSGSRVDGRTWALDFTYGVPVQGALGGAHDRMLCVRSYSADI
jgi:hypothetical protein